MNGPGGNRDPTGAPLQGERLLPEQELPCVWMTAGLLAWQLCPREYECDGCPLDAALTGGRTGRAPARIAGRLELPDDRGYHASHVWVQPRFARRARYGVDAIATRLLDRVGTVVLPPEEGRVERGEPAWWLADDGELVPFRAPDSGRVVRANHRVQRDPTLLLRAPYDEGWLLEVEVDPEAKARSAPLSAHELRRETARQLRDLHRAKLQRVAAGRGVGATLPDGGTRVRDLRALLGARRYHRLLRGVLG